MKKKIIKAAAVFIAALVLGTNAGGCAYIGLDTQTIITPPKANADQQEIHDLLKGDDRTYIYPKSGEYRSAIIMKDFTGDGREDAVGFTWMEPGIRVHFLAKDNGRWRILGEFDNNANQVDRVCFGDVNGNGQPDVLIGWGNTQSVAATLGVYWYDGGKMKELLCDKKYDEMVLADLNNDSTPEIFIMQKAVAVEDETTSAAPANAEVFTIRDDKVSEISSTEADNSVTKISSINFGKLSKDISGVVADGIRSDGSMLTQVFYLDEDNRLKSIPEEPNAQETVNLFSRLSGSGFTSTDINGDGMIELPMAKKLPALPEVLPEEMSLDSTSFLVKWCRPSLKNETGYVEVMSSFMNINEGYWFSTPFWMQKEITAFNDAANRTVTYYQVKSTEGTGGEEGYSLGSRLFSIRVFNRQSWEDRGKNSDYEILREENEQVYALMIYRQEAKYTLAMGKIKESFTLWADLQSTGKN